MLCCSVTFARILRWVILHICQFVVLLINCPLCPWSCRGKFAICLSKSFAYNNWITRVRWKVEAINTEMLWKNWRKRKKRCMLLVNIKNLQIQEYANFLSLNSVCNHTECPLSLGTIVSCLGGARICCCICVVEKLDQLHVDGFGC